MDNLTKKCEWKELSENAMAIIDALKQQKLLSRGYVTTRTICDGCDGHRYDCKGYVPKERVENEIH